MTIDIDVQFYDEPENLEETLTEENFAYEGELSLPDEMDAEIDVYKHEEDFVTAYHHKSGLDPKLSEVEEVLCFETSSGRLEKDLETQVNTAQKIAEAYDSAELDYDKSLEELMN